MSLDGWKERMEKETDEQLLSHLEHAIRATQKSAFLAANDTKRWSSTDLLEFIRSCLRQRGTTIHDALEPIIEAETARRHEKDKEQVDFLIDLVHRRRTGKATRKTSPADNDPAFNNRREGDIPGAI